MLSVEQGGALAVVARALAAWAMSVTKADGAVAGITDGPAVRFRYGVGVFEGCDFEASLLVEPARSLLEGRGLVGGRQRGRFPGGATPDPGH